MPSWEIRMFFMIHLFVFMYNWITLRWTRATIHIVFTIVSFKYIPMNIPIPFGNETVKVCNSWKTIQTIVHQSITTVLFYSPWEYSFIERKWNRYVNSFLHQLNSLYERAQWKWSNMDTNYDLLNWGQFVWLISYIMCFAIWFSYSSFYTIHRNNARGMQSMIFHSAIAVKWLQVFFLWIIGPNEKRIWSRIHSH